MTSALIEKIPLPEGCTSIRYKLNTKIPGFDRAIFGDVGSASSLPEALKLV